MSVVNSSREILVRGRRCPGEDQGGKLREFSECFFEGGEVLGFGDVSQWGSCSNRHNVTTVGLRRNSRLHVQLLDQL